MRHVRRAAENRSHQLPLNSDSASVNDAHSRQPEPVRLFEISLYRGLHIARSKGVEIEDVRDRNFDRIVLSHSLGLRSVRNPPDQIRALLLRLR